MTIQIRIATPRRIFLGQVALTIALIAAPAAFGQPAGKEYTVVMGNMDYGALPPGLKVGDTIIWVNHDTVIHSITARDHSFDVRINPGQTVRMPLATAGKFPFSCLFHPNMRGTLTVAAQ